MKYRKEDKKEVIENKIIELINLGYRLSEAKNVAEDYWKEIYDRDRGDGE